jgi:hypothetical protein
VEVDEVRAQVQQAAVEGARLSPRSQVPDEPGGTAKQRAGQPVGAPRGGELELPLEPRIGERRVAGPLLALAEEAGVPSGLQQVVKAGSHQLAGIGRGRGDD